MSEYDKGYRAALFFMVTRIALQTIAQRGWFGGRYKLAHNLLDDIEAELAKKQ